MYKILSLLLVSSVLLFCACDSNKNTAAKPADYAWFEQGIIEYVSSKPEFKIEGKDISALDPAALFGYSYYLYENDKKQESVFVYYLAQFRARVLLGLASGPMVITNSFFEKAKEDSGVLVLGKQVYLSEVTRKMLYTAILDSLGMVINGYAAAEPKLWAASMQEALDYEKTHSFAPERLIGADNMIPQADADAVIKKNETDFKELIDFVKTNEQAIKDRRKQNGM